MKVMEKMMRDRLTHIGDDSKITDFQTVGGGDINKAFFVKTEQHTYFIKGNQHVASHFFKSEAESLQLIKKTETISVPNVHYYDEPVQGEAALLIMDWVDQGSADVSEKLGHQLASMHKQTSAWYGFGMPTFVGTLDQHNDWTSTWIEYYRQYRLRPQLDYGVKKGRLPNDRRAKLETLIAQLERWLPAEPGASLLHGDLWGGNWIKGNDGQPYLVDPSSLYGDAAFEIAFTEVFGGFSRQFYESYQEVRPLPDDYEERKPLYQLFYLLVHLNLFGEGYGGDVDRILQRYVG